MKAILLGGVLCGVLDICAAFVQFGLRGVSPVRILQSIASGLLGPQAFQGGTATAALGAVLHFLIAFTAAAVFYAASRRMRWMVRETFATGLLYGAVVHGVMQFVVLPLSRFPPRSFDAQNFGTGLSVHMLFVGLPIAFAVRRWGAG